MKTSFMRVQISALVILTLLACQTHAQIAVVNKGGFQIHSGSSVKITGALTNDATAALVNNGTLYVSGTLTNDESGMSVGAGTLYLDGSSAQAVNGTNVFKTYHLVSANNSGITLNNDLSVSGTHTFSAGLIQSSVTPNYLIYEAGSSYTGDGDTKHVNGWVKKIGNTNFSFPVGNGTYERTAAIASLSASAEINCHYYYTGTQNLYNLNPPLIAVDSNEYWTINRVSGGNFKVNLNWDNNKVRFYNVLLIDVLVAEYNAGLWRSLGGSSTGNVATTGTVSGSSNALTSSSNYTFGFTSYPLPVKLISFSGSRQQQVSVLNWTAENEIQAGNYEVQRSSNGQQFITIGAVTPSNSGRRETYVFRDPIQFTGNMHYRLKMQDAGGKSSYSNVITLSENSNTDLFTVINPAKDAVIVISRAGTSGDFAYTLYNAGGQRVMTGMTTFVANGQISLPLPASVANGIYTLELRNTKTSFHQQVLVKQ